MSSSKTKKTHAENEGGGNYITPSLAREIAEQVVAEALRQHSRAIETHLKDIHKRLTVVEKQRL